MQCVVQKAFSGGDIDYEPDWLIDTSDFPVLRRDQLISQRFIRPATESDIRSAESVEEAEKETPPPSRRRFRKKKSLTESKVTNRRKKVTVS
jgi:hypothetical protein